MSNHDDLLKADAARRQAMISADVGTLSTYLSDELVWTHSSGRTDDKAAVLAAIESKNVVYLALDTEDVRVAEHGDIFIVSGTLSGQASRDGEPRALRNKFLSVWQRQDEWFQMLAWQSTGF